MLHIVMVIMTCYQCIVAIAVYAIHVATAVYTSRKFNQDSTSKGGTYGIAGNFRG